MEIALSPLQTGAVLVAVLLGLALFIGGSLFVASRASAAIRTQEANALATFAVAHGLRVLVPSMYGFRASGTVGRVRIEVETMSRHYSDGADQTEAMFTRLHGQGDTERAAGVVRLRVSSVPPQVVELLGWSVAGLAKAPTGDASFDALFETHSSDGRPLSWLDPDARAMLSAMADSLAELRVTTNRVSVSLRHVITERARLESAMQLVHRLCALPPV